MSHPLTYNCLARQRLHAACSILISIAISASAAFGSVPTASQDSGVFGKCWEVAVNSNLVTGPAADASAVYILDENNKLRAVDLATGNNAWSSEVGGELISNLLVLDDSIFFLTTSQSDIPNSS